MIKRYQIEAEYNVAGYSTNVKEISDGEWVKWEDIKESIEKIEEAKNKGTEINIEIDNPKYNRTIQPIFFYILIFLSGIICGMLFKYNL